jgi:hypothetical protein
MADIFHCVGFLPYDSKQLKRDAKQQKLSRMLGQTNRKTWGSARQHRHVPSLAGLSFDELSPDDWDVIFDSEDELSRRGNLERIYPCANTVGYYQQFFSVQRYFNVLLSKWLTQGSQLRHRILTDARATRRRNNAPLERSPPPVAEHQEQDVVAVELDDEGEQQDVELVEEEEVGLGRDSNTPRPLANKSSVKRSKQSARSNLRLRRQQRQQMQQAERNKQQLKQQRNRHQAHPRPTCAAPGSKRSTTAAASTPRDDNDRDHHHHHREGGSLEDEYNGNDATASAMTLQHPPPPSSSSFAPTFVQKSQAAVNTAWSNDGPKAEVAATIVPSTAPPFADDEEADGELLPSTSMMSPQAKRSGRHHQHVMHSRHRHQQHQHQQRPPRATATTASAAAPSAAMLYRSYRHHEVGQERPDGQPPPPPHGSTEPQSQLQPTNAKTVAKTYYRGRTTAADQQEPKLEAQPPQPSSNFARITSYGGRTSPVPPMPYVVEHSAEPSQASSSAHRYYHKKKKTSQAVVESEQNQSSSAGGNHTNGAGQQQHLNNWASSNWASVRYDQKQVSVAGGCSNPADLRIGTTGKQRR